ncbi:hypothetical protein NIES4071_85880 [Calothrix sp. NIES-4071]|nr:hypothetical protein NIES4071_85880 [Calothrix sp. NIES-4071]BAZ62855.1 hypothetical protein NIES4105_85810 [Calothrix sp. NIES-4105]
MRERVGQGKKTTTNSFSISTLKQPTRGFGLESSHVMPKPTTEQQAVKKPPSYDLNRISMRPQAKLTVGKPGDVYEQEADRVAHQVMQRMSNPANQQSVQQKEAPQEEEEKLQTKSLANSITPLVQREAMPEEEEQQQVQTKSLANSITPLQREAMPEEEEQQQVQTKSLANSITPLQREAMPEDEEQQQVQTKSLANSITPLQREAMPEEEEQQVQTKSLANSITPLQREAMPEEEEQQVQTKSLANSITPLQREAMPEEEEQQVQTKSLANSITPLQREAMPEEEEQQVQTKSLANSITPLQREAMPEEEEQQVQTKSLANSITPLQREAMPEEEEQAQMKPYLQRKSGGTGTAPASDVENSIKGARGSGQPMADDIRQPMEQAFGADFSGVKIHTDSRSHDLNQSVQARAFTTGSDIFFRQGEYSPGSNGGKELLAHELTHVVQQSGGAVQKKSVSTIAQKENKIQAKASPTSSKKKASATDLKEKPKTSTTPSSGKAPANTTTANNSKDNPQKIEDKGQKEDPNAKLNADKGEQQGQSSEKKGGLTAPPNGNGDGAATNPSANGGGAGASGEPSDNKNDKNQSKEQKEQKSTDLKTDSPQGTQDQAPDKSAKNAENPQKTEGDKQGQQKSTDPKADAEKGASDDKSGSEAGSTGVGEAVAGVIAGMPGVQGDVSAGLPGTQSDVSTSGSQTDVTSKTGGGEKAPASAEEDPEFQSVVNTTKEVAETQKEHEPSESKAKQAQDAAVPPGNEVDSKAQANQVGEMGQAQTPEFDAAAFKAKLMERIADMAPKNLKEADNFKDNNKLDSVKGDLSGQVKEEQKNSQGQLEEKTKEKPDTSGIEAKQVTPLQQNEPGKAPSQIGAEKAAPKQKAESEVEAPLQENNQKLDDKMSENNITEEQLKNSNEPEFQQAVAAKKDAQTNATQAPQQYRNSEQQIISNAQATAETTAQQHLEGMHDIRAQHLNEVSDKQAGGKGKDEEARTKVASDINQIYEKTKTEVEKTLGDLDGQVQQAFDAGATEAKKVFEDDVSARMKAYKKKRYSGFWGPGKWLVDQFLGLPKEVNAFYEEGRKLYIEKMDGVIDNVVSIISKGLTQAKAKIAEGKQQVQEYVAQLPQDLQAFGQETAASIDSKFEELQQTVDSKQDELIDTLAQKYQENLKAVDDRIEEMKAENRGFFQKAFDFIVGVVKTIIEMTKLLLSVLARAASVIGQIIANPIGFLGNLIQAVKQGFMNFMKNIGQHLEQGLIGWLTGTMAQSGIQMPESLNLEGIFSLAMQLLGFTYEAIRGQVAQRLGEEKVTYLEQNVEMFKTLSTKGVGGLWEFVKEQVGDLNTLILEPIKNYIIQTVIVAGIEWIMSLLTPASAFIKACKTIYEIVKFFIERAQQIADLINAILDSIVAIAKGSIDQAVKGVENALAKSIPVVISFLASLLGLGGIAGKIQSIFQKLRRPMEKAVDWVIDKGAKFANKVGGKVKNSKVGKKVGAAKDSAQEKYNAGKQWAEDKKQGAEQWVNDKKEGAEQWVNDKKEAAKDKVKNSKVGKKVGAVTDSAKEKYKAGKQWVEDKKEGAKNKLDEKKGAIKDKYKNTVDKGKEKVAAIVEWWKAKKQFKTEDGETHTLFFKGKEKSAELMVASTPVTLKSFIEKLKDKSKYPRPAGSPQEQALAEIQRLASEIDKIKKNFKAKKGAKDTSLPASYSASTGGAKIQELFGEIKEQLEIFYKHAGGKDKGLPPTEVIFNPTKPRSIGESVSSIDAEEMIAEPLSLNPGKLRGSEPSGESNLWKKVRQRNEGGNQVYIRGHLLNHHVHGPGEIQNLTPITGQLNGDMEREVEDKVKDQVLGQKKVVSYKVKVEYAGQGSRTHIPEEANLATALKFELYKMKKVAGKSGKDKADWVKDTKIYSNTLPHTLPPDTALGTATKPSVPPINIGNDNAKTMVKKVKRVGLQRFTKDQAEKIIAIKGPTGKVEVSELEKIDGIGSLTIQKLKRAYPRPGTPY